MIEYNYSIKRNEGDGWVTYIPNAIPKLLPNLVYIEGPNSSGKSTILNMIAIGMNGLKKDNIDSALKSKMNALLDKSYQEVSFNFSVSDGEKMIEIVKESVNDYPVIYEIKGKIKKPVSPDRVEREYNLIYDIPDNPTERLSQLTNTIKDRQAALGNKVSWLRSYIQQQINEVKTSRDPEKIENLKQDIAKVQNEYNYIVRKNDIDSGNFEVLEKYTYVKFFRNYLSSKNSIEKLTTQLKKEVTSKEIKVNKKYNKLLDTANNYIEKTKDLYDIITPQLRGIFPNEISYLDLWSKINFNDILRNQKFNNYYYMIIEAFKTKLEELVKSKKVMTKVEQTEIWDKIISILDVYHKKDIMVPGSGKNISEFIAALKDENKKQKEVVVYYNNINDLLDMIKEMKSNSLYLDEKVFPSLKSVEVDSIELLSNYSYITDSIKKNELKLNEINNNYDIYRNLCISIGLDVENDEVMRNALNQAKKLESFNEIKSFTEEQLMNRIKELKEEMEEVEVKCQKKQQYITSKKQELELLEKREPHKYQGKLNDLIAIVKTCLTLEEKLRNRYEEYITNIVNAKYKIKSNDEEQMRYYDEVSYYLGELIGEIKHINNVYKVKKIDVVERLVETREGKIIRFVDMGTGQSQSTYLLGQLNSSDNRKIIALFDEVAMMDQKSLKVIVDKLKYLYKEGKLLLGIIVQKGEDVKVKDIMEGIDG